MLPRLRIIQKEEARLWICESKESERCPQTTEQRTNPRHGSSRQPGKSSRKKQHHEAKEGHGNVV
jgi:hypothetical protein